MDLISIHPSLAGRDTSICSHRLSCLYFNPPVPRGTGRGRRTVNLVHDEDFNPPVPRGTGLGRTGHAFFHLCISIHPSLAGRDAIEDMSVSASTLISIHPSLAGRDIMSSTFDTKLPIFQSTRPSRDGTGMHGKHQLWTDNFNPPVPRGTGPCRPKSCSRGQDFNPPVPRGTGRRRVSDRVYPSYFNPPVPRGTGPRLKNF